MFWAVPIWELGTLLPAIGMILRKYGKVPTRSSPESLCPAVPRSVPLWTVDRVARPAFCCIATMFSKPMRRVACFLIRHVVDRMSRALLQIDFLSARFRLPMKYEIRCSFPIIPIITGMHSLSCWGDIERSS